MKISYHVPRKKLFIINDEDSVEHPWGDFCMSHCDSQEFCINERKIILPNCERKWIFFHRDKDGRIDHLFMVPFDNLGKGSELRPENHMQLCPICSGKTEDPLCL